MVVLAVWRTATGGMFFLVSDGAFLGFPQRSQGVLRVLEKVRSGSFGQTFPAALNNGRKTVE